MGEIKLREEDVVLLQPGRWLNDQLIAYYFEHFNIAASSAGTSALLLEPSIVYAACVLQDPAALREMMSIPTKRGDAPLIEQLLAHDMVIMPINDKDDPDQHEGISFVVIALCQGPRALPCERKGSSHSQRRFAPPRWWSLVTTCISALQCRQRSLLRAL